MLNTTFNKAHQADACVESYRKMGEALGGIKQYGKDTLIPLDKVLEVCGVQDAIWSLRCTIEPSENFLIEFACRYAEHVLKNYESLYPDDKRPRQAIEAARHCITDKSDAAADAAAHAAHAAAYAAADAAHAAAYAAAYAAHAAAYAAHAAAYAAAYAAHAAEKQWQKETFLKMLNEDSKLWG